MSQDHSDKKSLFQSLLFLLLMTCLTFSFSSIRPDTVNAAASVKLNITKKVVCPKTSVQGTKKKITWKSSKPSVAVVNSNGKVTAKKAGTTVITAQAGKKAYTCKITVKKHTYKKATCTKPKTCSRCNMTSGKALGHSYQSATCTSPQTCKRCGATTGAPLGHDYQEATCTEPQTCRRCGATTGSSLGHSYVDSIVKPTETERGYTLHECSRCKDTYKDQYTDFQLDPEQVYQDMIALKSVYPEGMRWTNDNYYRSPVLGGGYGCAGFAFALSDKAFGNLPARKHTNFSDLKVGDLLRVNGDIHSVVIMEITSYGVVLAEGNYNSSIHWGRTMSFAEIQRSGTYVTTRYPQ